MKRKTIYWIIGVFVLLAIISFFISDNEVTEPNLKLGKLTSYPILSEDNHVQLNDVEQIEVKEILSDDLNYICSYNAYNCDNFSTHAQAQAVFNACGGVSNDVHWLDGDDDGLACESLP